MLVPSMVHQSNRHGRRWGERTFRRLSCIWEAAKTNEKNRRSDVLCPFYRRDEVGRVNRIVCEGLRERGNLHQTFQNKEECTAYLEEQCCRDYKCCAIYRMLMREKYE